MPKHRTRLTRIQAREAPRRSWRPERHRGSPTSLHGQVRREGNSALDAGKSEPGHIIEQGQRLVSRPHLGGGEGFLKHHKSPPCIRDGIGDGRMSGGIDYAIGNRQAART